MGGASGANFHITARSGTFKNPPAIAEIANGACYTRYSCYGLTGCKSAKIAMHPCYTCYVCYTSARSNSRQQLADIHCAAAVYAVLSEMWRDINGA